MKPRTKIHFEVLSLQKNLTNPRVHENFIKSKHDFYFTTHYSKFVCLECNHSWKPAEKDASKKKIKCPSCGKTLHKARTNNSGIISEILIYSVVQAVDRFQVFQYLACWKHLYKNQKPRYHFRSLFEEWREYDKGKRVIIGRTSSYAGDGYSNSSYEIRAEVPRWQRSQYDYTTADWTCPGATFLPRFAKYQINDDFLNCDYRVLLKKMDSDPRIETLFKQRQKELVNHALYRDGYSRFWNQIKIAIRHKYKIKDPSIWFDYLETLHYFRKDLNNPFFICPKNLMKEHDRLMKKKQKVLEQQRRARENQERIERQKKLEKAASEYIEHKKVFFDLEIVKGDFLIKPLMSVDEFKEEGEALNHCVFTQDYYLKKDSLLMSARINGNRIETIEVCLKNFRILQSRGMGNNPTIHHKEIVQIVKTNMHLIRRKINGDKKKSA